MFSFKGIQPLIFDEFPYKKYMVKCTQPPQLKYLCFDHLEFRIYKGEGNVQLTAYYPFAFSVVSPSLKYSEKGSIVNNNGDMPANLNILYDLNNLDGNINLQLLNTDGTQISAMYLKGVSKLSDNDRYIMINTQTQLIEGLDEKKKKTGNLYNRYIESGDFFWPPVGRSVLKSYGSIQNGQQTYQPFVSATYTPLFY